MNRQDPDTRGLYYSRGMSYTPPAVADALFIARLFIISSSSCTYSQRIQALATGERPFRALALVYLRERERERERGRERGRQNRRDRPLSLSLSPKPFCSSLFRDRARRERGNSTPPSSLRAEAQGGREGKRAPALPPLRNTRARAFLPLRPRPARGTPLLLSAITYTGVVMLMRIPRANKPRAYLQPRTFPITR